MSSLLFVACTEYSSSLFARALPKAFRSSTRGRTEMANLSKKTLIREKTFTFEIMQMLIESRENEVSDSKIRDSFPHILHGRL